MEFIMNNLRKKIENLYCEEDVFVMAVSSDIHYSNNHCFRSDGVEFPASDDKIFNSFDELCDAIHFDAVCDLGDMVRGYEFDPPNVTKKDFITVADKYCKNADYPVFFVSGNHDSGVLWTVNGKDGSGNYSMDELFMPSERYDIIMKYMTRNAKILGVKNKLYYYCDLKNVRVIVLDTNDTEYKEISRHDIDINHHALSDEQVRWFSDIALDTKLPVVILTHCPIVKGLLTGSDTVDNSERILNIISEYNKCGGNIIAVLSGHTHISNSVEYGGIKHITFKNGMGETAVFAYFPKRKICKVFTK